MEKITIYKVYNPIFGRMCYSLGEVNDCETNNYSDPIEVELPEGFYVDENCAGDPMIFKVGDNRGYDIIPRLNGQPCLIGGEHIDSIPLKILSNE